MMPKSYEAMSLNVLFQSFCQRNQAQQYDNPYDTDHDSQDHIAPYHSQTHTNAQEKCSDDPKKYCPYHLS